MEKKDLEEVIKELLAKAIEDESAKDGWTTDTDIINDIGIDSIQIVRFMLSLEDRLGISLDFEDISFDDFSSIGSLVEFVSKSM
jgi:acyl carrier protein